MTNKFFKGNRAEYSIMDFESLRKLIDEFDQMKFPEHSKNPKLDRIVVDLMLDVDDLGSLTYPVKKNRLFLLKTNKRCLLPVKLSFKPSNERERKEFKYIKEYVSKMNRLIIEMNKLRASKYILPRVSMKKDDVRPDIVVFVLGIVIYFSSIIHKDIILQWCALFLIAVALVRWIYLKEKNLHSF